MLKRIKRGTDMRRFKQVQQNLMADSAAAVADMMGGEQQEEQENHELSGGFLRKHVLSWMCVRAGSC